VEVATLPVFSLKPGVNVALAPPDSGCEPSTYISPGTPLDYGSALNSYSTINIPVLPTLALLPQENPSSTDVLISVPADVLYFTSPLSLLPIALAQHAGDALLEPQLTQLLPTVPQSLSVTGNKVPSEAPSCVILTTLPNIVPDSQEETSLFSRCRHMPFLPLLPFLLMALLD